MVAFFKGRFSTFSFRSSGSETPLAVQGCWLFLFIASEIFTLFAIIVNFYFRQDFYCKGCNSCSNLRAMRAKVDASKRHTARGVSLPPDMEKAAVARATRLDVSFSKYVQRLIRLDIERAILKP